MAVRDEIKEQRSKLKGQGFKAHLEYFWDYYKIHTIVGIFFLILAVTMIRDIAGRKPTYLYSMMVNSYMEDGQEALQNEFLEYAGANPDEYSCVIDGSVSFTPGSSDQMAVAAMEKIMATSAANELDSIVSDYAVFYHYAAQGTFMDLREVYDQKDLDLMEDRLVYIDMGYVDYLDSDEYTDYITSGKFDENNKYAVMADRYTRTGEYERTPKSEMQDPVPVGIILDNSAVLKEKGAYRDTTAVAGVVTSTQRVDNAREFINFLKNAS